MTGPGAEARLCCRGTGATVLVSTEGIMTYSLEHEHEQKCKDSQDNRADGAGAGPPSDGVGWERGPQVGGQAEPRRSHAVRSPTPCTCCRPGPTDPGWRMEYFFVGEHPPAQMSPSLEMELSKV